MSDFVLDCSMTMAWCHRGRSNPGTDAVLASLKHEGSRRPGPLAVGSGQRAGDLGAAGRIHADQIARFLDFLSGLPIVVDERTAEMALGETLRWRDEWGSRLTTPPIWSSHARRAVRWRASTSR